MMWTEKHVLVLKNVSKRAKHVISIPWRSQGIQSMEWKLPDSPVKKKFLAQQSVRNVMLIVFWVIKGPIITGVLENGATTVHKNFLLQIH